MRSVTSAPAPMMLPAPMRAWFITIAPIPMSTSSSITHPWTIARWPIVTRAPIVQGTPASTWTTVPS